MKTSAILVGSSAALAAAQATFPAGFPECGQVCITNMLNLANHFGCGLDPLCLCTQPDFLYGIRDCSNEYCQDPNAAAQTINYGAQYCADGGVAISGLPGNTASASTSAYTTVLATGSTTDAGSTGSEGVTSGVAVTTDEILSTLTDVITSTVGSTTVFSTLEPSITGTSSSGSVSTTTETSVVTTTSGSATESGPNTLSTVVSSTISSVVSSTVAVTSSDVTITTTNSEGQTETAAVPTTVPVSEGGSSETAAPGNLAAQHTAGPAAIMAAAGMAAALLL
ncbi:hypothetical protein DL771_005634 [Monosporascus sp. 5C6A]|nr:hypothetical protein DL771_005634 [Monosporascus sp. 5C6A]